MTNLLKRGLFNNDVGVEFGIMIGCVVSGVVYFLYTVGQWVMKDNKENGNESE